MNYRKTFPSCITSGQVIAFTHLISAFVKDETDQRVRAFSKILEESFGELLQQALRRYEKIPVDSGDLEWFTLKQALRLLSIDSIDGEQIREAREKYLLAFENVGSSQCHTNTQSDVRKLLHALHASAVTIHKNVLNTPRNK